jgi:hypothetical protein
MRAEKQRQREPASEAMLHPRGFAVAEKSNGEGAAEAKQCWRRWGRNRRVGQNQIRGRQYLRRRLPLHECQVDWQDRWMRWRCNCMTCCDQRTARIAVRALRVIGFARIAWHLAAVHPVAAAIAMNRSALGVRFADRQCAGDAHLTRKQSCGQNKAKQGLNPKSHRIHLT